MYYFSGFNDFNDVSARILCVLMTEFIGIGFGYSVPRTKTSTLTYGEITYVVKCGNVPAGCLIALCPLGPKEEQKSLFNGPTINGPWWSFPKFRHPREDWIYHV